MRRRFNARAASDFDEFYDALKELALDGDTVALKFLIEQTIGKAQQHINVTSPEDDARIQVMKEIAKRLGPE